MLRITKAEDQAMRLALRLAADGGQLTLGSLAARESLPEPTVAKLLGLMRRGGVVSALRGRNCGYELAASPADTSVASVLRALGTDLAPQHHCFDQPGDGEPCPRADDCGLRSVWRHLQRQVTQLVEGTSLADLLRAESDVDDHLDTVWPLTAAAADEAVGPDAGISQGVDRR